MEAPEELTRKDAVVVISDERTFRHARTTFLVEKTSLIDGGDGFDSDFMATVDGVEHQFVVVQVVLGDEVVVAQHIYYGEDESGIERIYFIVLEYDAFAHAHVARQVVYDGGESSYSIANFL